MTFRDENPEAIAARRQAHQEWRRKHEGKIPQRGKIEPLRQPDPTPEDLERIREILRALNSPSKT